MRNDYADKLDDVMSYAVINMNDRGVKAKIRSKEDLRSFLLDMNTQKGKKPGDVGYLSDRFINRLVQGGDSRRYVGATIGSRGRVAPIREVSVRDDRKPMSMMQTIRVRGRERVVYRDSRGRFVRR